MNEQTSVRSVRAVCNADNLDGGFAAFGLLGTRTLSTTNSLGLHFPAAGWSGARLISSSLFMEEKGRIGSASR